MNVRLLEACVPIHHERECIGIRVGLDRAFEKESFMDYSLTSRG